MMMTSANPILRRLTELASKIDLGEGRDALGSPVGCCELPPRRWFPSLYISGRKNPIDLPTKGKALVDYRVTGRSMNQRGEEDPRHSMDIAIQSIEPVEHDEDKEPKEGEAAKLLSDLRKVTGFARLSDLKAEVKRVRGLPNFVVDYLAPMQMGTVARREQIRRRAGTKGAQLRSAIERHRAAGLLSSLRRLVEFDDRRRNENGQFVGNDTGGVDPNSMAAAYGPPAAEPVDPTVEPHIERVKRFFIGRRQKDAAA